MVDEDFHYSKNKNLKNEPMKLQSDVSVRQNLSEDIWRQTKRRLTFFKDD